MQNKTCVTKLRQASTFGTLHNVGMDSFTLAWNAALATTLAFYLKFLSRRSFQQLAKS